MESQNSTEKIPEKKITDDSTLSDKIPNLIESIEHLTKIQNKIYKQNQLGHAFLRGTLFALGSTVGLAVTLAILFYLLKALGIFDNFNDILNNANDIKNIYN